jgi:bifunctional non-homologous end joining protein LigD
LGAGLAREKQPVFVAPELAEEATAPPEGGDWLHEIKLDGYRMQARKAGGRVQMLTRSGLDWTHRMRAVAEAVAALPVQDVTLDGEVVVLDEEGISSFANLQASFQSGERHALTYFCFDLLHVEGGNARELPLRKRKELLAEILPGDGDGTLRMSEHLEGKGPEIFAKACELKTEGIISKLGTATYRTGRSSNWLKSKCLHEQEFVVGGFTLSTDGPDRVGSLLLGYYADGELIYAGRSGTGFTQKMRRELREMLTPLQRRSPAFDKLPAEAKRDAVWAEPKLVAQVRFATWTSDDLVRQAAFLGLREDKRPEEVRREGVATAPRPKAGRGVAAAEGNEAKRGAKGEGKASHRGSRGEVAAKTVEARAVGDEEPAVAGARAAKVGTKAAAGSGGTAVPVRLTHPEKVLDPESGLTKRQLAEFYWAVAERMLPHIAGRPLSLVRCPEGAGKPCFYQKHVNHMLPAGIGGVDVPDKKTGVPELYITLDSAEALAGLAQMGVLEVHPWGSRNEDLEHPNRIIFDLDPDEELPWTTLCEAAAEVRKRLKRAGLESFLKTTGGKGLHIVAPIQPEPGWDVVKTATHNLVLAMERANPGLYLTKMTKAARKGKIFLDYLRNERGATAVAPFSPRARLGVPVSLPLPWTALKLPQRPVFRVSEFASWRERLRSDPWKGMASVVQRLDPEAMAAR